MTASGATTGATTGVVVPKKHQAIKPRATRITMHNMILDLFGIC